MSGADADRPTEPPKREGDGRQLPSFDTSALFGPNREVILVHKGEPYRLRQTQSGKLILTK
jgi:hemin uptake protein HemP